MLVVHVLGLLSDRLTTDERGATAVEYALLAALIAAVIVLVVATLGGWVQTAFDTISGCFADPSSC